MNFRAALVVPTAAAVAFAGLAVSTPAPAWNGTPYDPSYVPAAPTAPKFYKERATIGICKGKIRGGSKARALFDPFSYQEKWGNSTAVNLAEIQYVKPRTSQWKTAPHGAIEFKNVKAAGTYTYRVRVRLYTGTDPGTQWSEFSSPATFKVTKKCWKRKPKTIYYNWCK